MPGVDEGRDKLRKASGSCLISYDPEIPESGNRAGSSLLLVFTRGITRRSETSQYPEEQKENLDSPSSGERKGNSLNPVYVKACMRCMPGVAGSRWVQVQLRRHGPCF